MDAGDKFGTGDQFVLDIAKRTRLPCFLLLNKIDTLHKDRLLPLIAQYQELHQFAEVIPISALKHNGLDTLLDAIVKALPEGPHYFPADQITDQPERFLVAELIREQVLQFTSQEVPHATTVLIDSFEEGAKLTKIAATVYCEREGQKAILIGKQGANLKKIGTHARQQIEQLLGTKVFLEMFVKVHAGWRESRTFVEEFGLAPPVGAPLRRATHRQERIGVRCQSLVANGQLLIALLDRDPQRLHLAVQVAALQAETSAVRLTLPWFSSSFFRM